jgi:hypothetical protein
MQLMPIQGIVFMPEVGSIFEGVVEELAEYGAFIKFKGKTGLLHVSEYDHRRIEHISEVLKVGDTDQVQNPGRGSENGQDETLAPCNCTAKPDGTMPTDEENELAPTAVAVVTVVAIVVVAAVVAVEVTTVVAAVVAVVATTVVAGVADLAVAAEADR